MLRIFKPWQLVLIVLAAWVNRWQQETIEYLRTENAVLREKLGKKRILLDDDHPRRLAVKGKVLGFKRLSEVGTLFTPDTILRWHRELIAKKWDHSEQRKNMPGRPRVRQEIVELVLRLASENPTWGYDRIQGALVNLGYHITDTTVGNLLKANGIEPAPQRTPNGSWKRFLKAHWEVMTAIDFTTVEVWTKGGLTTIYLLFVMELKTRRVCFAGSTTNPNEAWMEQKARELTDHHDGFLLGKEYLVMDRDTKFSESFRAFLKREGIQSVRLPRRSPNLNAHMERFFRSIKTECLGRMIFFGETMLCRAVGAYLKHYHEERNHQGLDNELIIPFEGPPDLSQPIETRESLGGMLKFYHRRAA